MARLVFVSLVLVGTAMLLTRRSTAGGRASTRLILLGFAIVAVVTILNPEVTTRLAKIIGIGRGTDLVFYLTTFGLLFLAGATHLRFRDFEDRITALTQQLALRDWPGLAAPEADGDHTQRDPDSS